MPRIRYLLITTALLVFTNWAIRGYRSNVLDAAFLVYGQSVVVPGFTGRVPVSGPRPADIIAQRSQNAITLERTTCYGACPAYLLQIDLSGNVFFMPGAPANRHEVRTSTIPASQFHELVAGFAAIHFSELNDLYPGNIDLPSAYIGLTLDGKTKRIQHGDGAPPGLDELERTIERTANIHRWLHGDQERFTLQSPVAGPSSGGGGEDLKQEMYVRHDAFERIKPGMTPLMQFAGGGGILAEVEAARRRMVRVTDEVHARMSADALQRALQRGADVNAADETGWTALMIAAVTGQPQSVSALLDAGARIDQRDHHGDTALIGAAAVRFGDLGKAAEILRILLARGATPDAVNDLKESALMWAARAGTPESMKVLLDAAANPTLLDQAGHDALFYLRKARADLTFDPKLVQRYDQAEAVLGQSLLKRR